MHTQTAYVIGAVLILAILSAVVRRAPGAQRLRTLTAYGVAVILVLAIVNTIAWFVGGEPRLHSISIFSGGFIAGMLGMYLAAYLYGYRRVR